MKLFLSCAALALLLSSCGNFFDSFDESEIPGYTRDWLRGEQGQTLTFRNGAGQTRTLRVRRREELMTSSGRTGTSYYQVLNVRIEDTAPDSLLSVSLEGNSNKVNVSHHGVAWGAINTHENGRKTYVESYRNATTITGSMAAEDTTLAGRQYRFVGRIRGPITAHPTDTVTAVYISRYEGVIGFMTKRAGLWHRD
ncbi:hypothetical protein LJY25_09825 [Hymenobacter sp. BT175]|uniref:hypothetical protein n=1 Tax=Hymenobacter translucens TaxID=2886507 RepID=UPI001D0F21A4|nr:hypothetical protein [Hymenobacter translucens]MCC2546740.1 hypothetical protein [Hymenobacter translucens]